MARIAIIVFLLLPISSWSQKYSLDSSFFSEEPKQINFRQPSISTFKRNFEVNNLNDTNEEISSFKPYKVFKKSSTIYDITKIILFTDGKFIGYYHGCTAEGVTAGNYLLKDNLLIITSSKNVYTNLNRQQVFKLIDYPFFELGSIKYQITNEGLVYLR